MLRDTRVVPAAQKNPARIAIRLANRRGTWTPAKPLRKGRITKPLKPSSARRAARRLVRQ